jgi:hypothetical protein
MHLAQPAQQEIPKQRVVLIGRLATGEDVHEVSLGRELAQDARGLLLAGEPARRIRADFG